VLANIRLGFSFILHACRLYRWLPLRLRVLNRLSQRHPVPLLPTRLERDLAHRPPEHLPIILRRCFAQRIRRAEKLRRALSLISATLRRLPSAIAIARLSS